MLTCRTSHAKWKVNMPKCGKYHTKWKVNMPTCRKSHAKWKVNCQNVANTIQNGRWTCPHVVNPMQNGRWTCPNVANTMQNDKFKFQTVANTRQMVPAKKSKKKSQTCSKKNSQNYFAPLANYGLVNQQLDPENSQFLMDSSLPTPMTARVELLIYQRVANG